MKKTSKRAIQEILEDEETITIVYEKEGETETEIDIEELAEVLDETITNFIDGEVEGEEVVDEEVEEIEDETDVDEDEETEEDLEEDIEDDEEDVEEDEEDIVEDEEDEIVDEEEEEEVVDEEIDEEIDEDEEVIEEEEEEEEEEDEEEDEEEEEEENSRNIWDKKDNTEKRFFKVETRVTTKGKKNIVEGHAAVFGELSEDLGGFREKINKGAFDGVLDNDVRAFFNHDPNFLLARTSSGTLKLGIDKRGLKYSFDVPDTSAGRDLLVSMKRGDITQSSFTVEKDSWGESKKGTEIRTIEKVGRLFDVSPVSIPAYPTANDLSIAQRSRMTFKDKTKMRSEQDYEYKRSLLELKINILKRK